MLSPQASVAYVIKDSYFTKPPYDVDSGWQHYEVGMVGTTAQPGAGLSKTVRDVEGSGVFVL